MGTAKKRCANCRHYGKTEDMLKVNISHFCGFQCAAEYGLKNKHKGQKKIFAEKKRKFNDNDVKKQHDLTQPIFNRMRVLQEKKWFMDRGLEPECISCGKTNMDWCCGHFKTRGSQGNLRYDEKNTYLQCNRYCNKGLSGNIEGNKNTRGYKQGLIERFGEKEAQAIIDYCETNTQVRKFTGPELKKMRKEFSKKLKELQNSTP